MSNPKGCKLFVRESIKLLSLLCPNQGGATSILHSSRPFRYSLLLTIPGIVAYIPVYNAAFLPLSYERQTHASLPLENGNSFLQNHILLRTPPDRAMALQQPTSRRCRGASSPRKIRPSPITKSRAIEKRPSPKPAVSKHLNSFVCPAPYLEPSTSLDGIAINTSIPPSILLPNFPQSSVSGYGSSVFLAHASCPSNAAATAYLAPNRLQPPSHHYDSTSRPLAACRLHRYP